MPVNTRLTTLLAAAALAVAFPAAGCGGDDEEPAGGGGGEPAQTEESGQDPEQLVAAGDAQAGREVFGDNCAACHGEDGQGGSGPSLRQESYRDAELVVNQIINGGGGMPAFGDQLEQQQIADVSAYVTKDLAGGP